MNKNRLEAFSDGIIAIVITVMLLQLKIPSGTDFKALAADANIYYSYILSFLYVGIYWNNHHHLLQMARTVNGKILWANLYLIFWLTAIPLATAWAGQTDYAPHPTAAYAFVLLMCSIAFWILKHQIMKNEGPDSDISRMYRHDKKGDFSIIYYIVAIILSYFNSICAMVVLATIAVIWFYPDKRIEKHFSKAN